jgi:hypothetical protein
VGSTINNEDMGEFRVRLEEIMSDHGSYFSLMKEGKYSRGQLGLSPRMGNYWITNDLFLDNSVKRSYRYNLLEAFWIKLVQNLKKYNIQKDYILHLKNEVAQTFTLDKENISLDVLKKMLEEYKDFPPSKIKEFVESEEMKNLITNINYSVLELLLVLIIFERDTIKILICKNEIVVVNESKGEFYPSEESVNNVNSMTHFSVSLNQVLGEVLDSIPIDDAEKQYDIVTKKEAEILRVMREDSPDSIEVVFDKTSRKPISINVTKENKVDSSARLNHFILTNGYQNITIKTQNGQITQYKNTSKHKL